MRTTYNNLKLTQISPSLKNWIKFLKILPFFTPSGNLKTALSIKIRIFLIRIFMINDFYQNANNFYMLCLLNAKTKLINNLK